MTGRGDGIGEYKGGNRGARAHWEGARTARGSAPDRNFRFYDSRQKYLLFVNIWSEKLAVADRMEQELAGIRPVPAAVRVFDAGVDDGTVLTRVMRWIHQCFPTIPFYVVGKEINLEDARLDEVLGSRKYLDVTRDAPRKHGELWFRDETFLIAARRN